MLEMFTDQNPLRSDDFMLPADIGHIALRKKSCYNKNEVGDRPPPIKSVERMKHVLTMAAIVNNMTPYIKADDFTAYQPLPGQVMIVKGITGHDYVVLSITVAHESGRITITYNNGMPPRLLYSEEDLAAHAIEFGLYAPIPLG